MTRWAWATPRRLVVLLQRQLRHVVHIDGVKPHGDVEEVLRREGPTAEIVEVEARDAGVHAGHNELAAPRDLMCLVNCPMIATNGPFGKTDRKGPEPAWHRCSSEQDRERAFRKCQTELARNRPTSGRLANLGSSSAKLGPNTGQLQPKSTKCGRNPVNLGQVFADRNRPKLGRS